ncbi:MAG TPA: hypothetical protein VMO81_04640 [Aestuariivirgaceae bacterium]|nr:hypothetical protein [Aestuariivirgaceae bacterium]
MGVALLFMAWVVPQAIHIEASGLGEFHDAHVTWAYAALCLIATAAGFCAGTRHRPLGWRPALAVRPLLGGTVALVVFGGFCALKVYGMAEAGDLGTEWTGAITAYHLGTQTLIYAFALSWLIYLRTGRLIFLALMCVALLFVVPGLMAGVKRSVIFELAFVVAAGLHFVRGMRLSRFALVAACIFGTILIHQVGAVRNYIAEGHGNAVQAVVSGVMFEQFEYFNLQRAPELSQAVSDIAIYSETMRFDGFAHHWNRLVHQYVPAFLLGRETKDSLKVDVTGGYGEATSKIWFSRGATRTGFSDSFRGFWLFGPVLFLVIGWLFGRLYTSSLDGNLPAQFYYLVLFSDGLLAFTESTARFVAHIPFLLLATLPIFLLATHGRRRTHHLPYAANRT